MKMMNNTRIITRERERVREIRVTFGLRESKENIPGVRVRVGEGE